MAKKNRSRRQRQRPQQRPGAALGPAEEAAPEGQQSEAAPVAPAPRPQQFASPITAPRRTAPATQAVTIDVDARVPYFTSDLRRIAITAAVMLAIIIGASFLVH